MLSKHKEDKMRKTLKIIAIILGAVLLDQISKGVLLYMLTGGVPITGAAFEILPYPYMIARVTGWFNIVFTWNPGTSFSLFRALGEAAPMVIIVLTGVVIGALGYYLFTKANKRYERVALALIIGGALGNLVDRIRFDAVIDFLDLHWKTWHWPAFNLADICITVGAAILIAGWIFGKKLAKSK